MKATMSRDQKLRFNVTIAVRCGFMNLVEAVGWENRHNDLLILPKTRRDAINMFKRAYRSEGDNLWAEIEDVPKEKMGQIEIHIAKLFPELS